MCDLIFSDKNAERNFQQHLSHDFKKYLNYNLLDDSYCFEAIADKDRY